MTPHSNPLLDDFLEDHHQYLIEKGNLPRKRKTTVLTLSNPIVHTWQFLGYIARIHESHCDACGSTHSQLIGVFSREKSLNDPSAVRETALDLRRFRDLNIRPETLTIRNSVPLCAECVDAPLSSESSEEASPLD